MYASCRYVFICRDCASWHAPKIYEYAKAIGCNRYLSYLSGSSVIQSRVEYLYLAYCAQQQLNHGLKRWSFPFIFL